jgi:hypothetical protein
MNPAGMASGAAATGGGGGVVAGAPGADPNAGGATAAIGGSATPAPAPRGAALRLAPVMGVLAVALFATLL